ncbi:hypothetical protein OAA87_02070 [Amylibacter sp.]|nr:hypothetical protein [Amylibacter sp.]
MRIILTLLLLIISTQTSSGFLDNRQAWQTMPELKKTGYVMGVVDEMIQLISSDIPEESTRKLRLRDCIIKMQLDTDAIKDIVDNHYTDLGNWQNPPNIALRQGLWKVCK